jgi:putative peptidoglycan lipid II flippase
LTPACAAFSQGHPRHDRRQRTQLLVVGGAIIASSSPSAVSWLYFANRLIDLPLGIVGVAMGTVLVPELTRAARR